MIHAPIGPFFGNGWGEAYNFVSAPLAVTHASLLPRLVAHPFLAAQLAKTGAPNIEAAMASIDNAANAAKKRRGHLIKPFI